MACLRLLSPHLLTHATPIIKLSSVVYQTRNDSKWQQNWQVEFLSTSHLAAWFKPLLAARRTSTGPASDLKYRWYRNEKSRTISHLKHVHAWGQFVPSIGCPILRKLSASGALPPDPQTMALPLDPIGNVGEPLENCWMDRAHQYEKVVHPHEEHQCLLNVYSAVGLSNMIRYYQ